MAILDVNNLSLNDISVDTVTNSDCTGIFDKLMEAVNKNILIQYNDSRIDSGDYANVYLGSLQAVLSQSIQFALQEQLIEAQVAAAITDNALKVKQLEIADIDKSTKQYQLDNLLPEQLIKIQEEIDILQTQDSEALLNGTKDRLLKDAEVSMKAKQEDLVDSQIVGSGFDNTLKSEQAAMSTYERTVVQPKQLEKLEEEIDILQTQESEMGLDGAKKRLIMDEELETAGLQQIILATEEQIKTAQHLEIVDATTRANTQLDDGVLTSTEQRLGMVVDTASKQYQLTNLLPEQLTKIQEEIDLLQTQDSEMGLNGTKDRLIKDEQIETANKQQLLLDTEEETKQFEATFLLPEQLIKIQEEIDILQSQDSDIVAKTVIAIAESAKNVLLKQEQIESEALNNGLDGVISNQILDIKKGVDVKERQMFEAESTGTKQRLIMDEELESAGLQQIILQTEEELKTAQKDEVLSGTTRSDSDLTDKHLTTAKQRLLLDEELETAGLQQIILETEEELKTAQKDEVVDSTTRSNTQLNDELVTSIEQRLGMVVDKESKQYQLDNLLPKELEVKTEQALGAYTERLTKDKQAAKLGLDNVMKNSEASRDADGNFVYVPNYVAL
jgi:hypothetical protein